MTNAAPTLRADRWGTGSPVTVLLHGGGASARNWWRVGPELAARTAGTVYAPDLPGHGGTSGIDGPTDLQTLADAVRAFCAPLAVDMLVGHSLGATVALRIAGDDPGCCRRLVLEEPASVREITTRLVARMMARDIRDARADRTGYTAELLRRNPDWLHADGESRTHGLVTCDETALEGAILALRHDLVAMSRVVTVPTLLVWADPAKGSSVGCDERREVLDALLAGAAVQLPTGHSVHRGCAGEYVEYLARWLGSPDVESTHRCVRDAV